MVTVKRFEELECWKEAGSYGTPELTGDGTAVNCELVIVKTDDRRRRTEMKDGTLVARDTSLWQKTKYQTMVWQKERRRAGRKCR